MTPETHTGVPTLTTQNPWLTPHQAADYLHMHVETIRDLLRKGDIAGRKKGKSTKARWLVHIQALNDYIEGNNP